MDPKLKRFCGSEGLSKERRPASLAKTKKIPYALQSFLERKETHSMSTWYGMFYKGKFTRTAKLGIFHPFPPAHSSQTLLGLQMMQLLRDSLTCQALSLNSDTPVATAVKVLKAKSRSRNCALRPAGVGTGSILTGRSGATATPSHFCPAN